ncbi:DUF4084 domain-containing protein [Paenibacillus pinistramenti]|uniref:DUF4084 domain-containing protein n=1 Tax=Paenibacillus pinistramenti TaxID=1768003 RepID=UPI001107F2A0|nr:DUF4084 domain-containing protein [Paenibacillus pinistramenti]
MTQYNRRLLPFLFLIAFVGVYYVWIIVWRNNEHMASWGGDLLSVSGSLISAVWLSIGAKNARRSKRVFWTLLAIGSFQYTIAEMIWWYNEQILRTEGYESNLVDIFYLLQVAFYLAAFAHMFTRLRSRSRLYKMIFDLLTTMTIAFTFSWHYLIGPVLGEGESDRITLLINLAYPASDLGLLVCGFALFWGANPYFYKKQQMLIFFSVILQAGADSSYLYMLSVDEYFSGSLVDPLFILCLLLIGYAGLLERAWEPAAEEAGTNQQVELPKMELSRTVLPYLSVIILFVLMIDEPNGVDAISIGTGLSILFIILRQMLIIRENRRLLHDLYAKTDELEASEQLYRSLFDYNPDAVYSLDLEGRFTSANSATTQLLGYPLDELMGSSIWEFADEQDLPKLMGRMDKLKQGEPQSDEITIRSRDGSSYALSLTSVPIKVRGRIVGIFGIGKDITVNKLNEKKITYLAYHDSLTGLLNRASFENRLTEAAEQAAAHEMFAVIFIDLDRFKTINDTFGHDFGDALLVSVAKRLRECLEERDSSCSIARQGGDEFTILIKGIPGVKEVKAIAENILYVLSKPYWIRGQEINNMPSIGISLYPLDGDTPVTLMKQADIALYEVKYSGKGSYRLYSEIDPYAQRFLRLERDLAHALDNRELLLHYQPQIDALTGKMTGAEALLRWNHPEYGLLYPGEFIPLAESSGYIVPIGEWVLRTACEQVKIWHSKDHHLKIAVNLSRIQFRQQDLVEMIGTILQETELDPAFLSLELTESTVMQADAIPKLKKLKAYGVQLSLDDFGSGFSSLSYLESFPLDKLKLAPEFAQKIESGVTSQTVVSSIIYLASQLNIEVIAEGVETERQAALLKQIQCSEMQGYLFGRPISAEELEYRLTHN